MPCCWKRLAVPLLLTVALLSFPFAGYPDVTSTPPCSCSSRASSRAFLPLARGTRLDPSPLSFSDRQEFK